MERKHYRKQVELRASADPDASHKVFLVHTESELRTYTATIFGRTVHNLTKEEYEIINGPLFID